MNRNTARAAALLLCGALLSGCSGQSSLDLSPAETTTTAETTTAPAEILPTAEDYLGKWVMDYRGEPDESNPASALRTWWGIDFPPYAEFMNLDIRSDGTYLWEDELWHNLAEGAWQDNGDGSISLDFPGDEVFGNTGGRGTATCTLMQDGRLYFHWMVENLIADISFHAVYSRGGDFYDDSASKGSEKMQEQLAGYWIPDHVCTAEFTPENGSLVLTEETEPAAEYAGTVGRKMHFADDGTFEMPLADADGNTGTASGNAVYNADGVYYYTAQGTWNTEEEKEFSDSGILVLSGGTLAYIRAKSAENSDGSIVCTALILTQTDADGYAAYDTGAILYLN